jgi:hypothetical protein
MKQSRADKTAIEITLLKSRPGGRMVILAGYESTEFQSLPYPWGRPAADHLRTGQRAPTRPARRTT